MFLYSYEGRNLGTVHKNPYFHNNSPLMLKYITLLSLVFLTSCTLPATSPSSGTTPTQTPTVTPTVMISSPTYGSGKHTVTIFADFQCPACISFSKTIGPIFEDYASRGILQITYKQYPLTNIHKNAERDAIAWLCAAEQGKYMEYKKNLYALEQSKNWATVSDSDRVNAALGTTLDANKLTECLTTSKYLPQVRAEMKEGDTLWVSGTPTIFIDGKKLDLSIFKSTDILRSWLDQYLGVPASGSGMVK